MNTATTTATDPWRTVAVPTGGMATRTGYRKMVCGFDDADVHDEADHAAADDDGGGGGDDADEDDDDDER